MAGCVIKMNLLYLFVEFFSSFIQIEDWNVIVMFFPLLILISVGIGNDGWGIHSHCLDQTEWI